MGRFGAASFHWTGLGFEASKTERKREKRERKRQRDERTQANLSHCQSQPSPIPNDTACLSEALPRIYQARLLPLCSVNIHASWTSSIFISFLCYILYVNLGWRESGGIHSTGPNSFQVQFQVHSLQ